MTGKQLNRLKRTHFPVAPVFLNGNSGLHHDPPDMIRLEIRPQIKEQGRRPADMGTAMEVPLISRVVPFNQADVILSPGAAKSTPSPTLLKAANRPSFETAVTPIVSSNRAG